MVSPRARCQVLGLPCGRTFHALTKCLGRGAGQRPPCAPAAPATHHLLTATQLQTWQPPLDNAAWDWALTPWSLRILCV